MHGSGDEAPPRTSTAHNVMQHTALTALAVGFWFFSSKGLHTIALLGFAVWTFDRHRMNAWAFWRRPPGALFLVTCGLCVLSAAWSVAPGLTLRDAVKPLPLLVAAWVLPAFLEKPGRLGAFLGYSAAAWSVMFAGDLVRLAHTLGSALLENARVTEPYVMNHPNVASMMAAAGGLICFFALAAGFPRLSRMWLPALGLIIHLTYLYVLASRGPQVAFAIALAVAGFLLPGRRAKAAWAALLVLGALVLLPNLARINRRFAAPDTGSLNERVVVWRHTAALAAQRPWLGYGYGKKVFEATYYNSSPPPARHHFPHAHNYWLMTGFGTGILGLAALAFAWAWLGVALLRVAPHLPVAEWPVRAVLALLALVHVYGLGDYPDSAVRILMLSLVPVGLAGLAMARARSQPSRRL